VKQTTVSNTTTKISTTSNLAKTQISSNEQTVTEQTIAATRQTPPLTEPYDNCQTSRIIVTNAAILENDGKQQIQAPITNNCQEYPQQNSGKHAKEAHSIPQSNSPANPALPN
jgi:hypothetical protein